MSKKPPKGLGLNEQMEEYWAKSNSLEEDIKQKSMAITEAEQSKKDLTAVIEDVEDVSLN